MNGNGVGFSWKVFVFTPFDRFMFWKPGGIDGEVLTSVQVEVEDVIPEGWRLVGLVSGDVPEGWNMVADCVRGCSTCNGVVDALWEL